jgi:hypothetical protein
VAVTTESRSRHVTDRAERAGHPIRAYLQYLDSSVRFRPAPLNKSRDQARRFLTDSLVKRASKERHDDLERQKPQLMGMAPDLTSEAIDERIEVEYQNGMARCAVWSPQRSTSNSPRAYGSLVSGSWACCCS